MPYADEAESAERAEAWPQAMALWKRAIATSPAEQPAYAEGLARCERQITVDAELASIATRGFRIPTLEARNSDRLDFHEVSVWALLKALRLAYRAGQSTLLFAKTFGTFSREYSPPVVWTRCLSRWS